MSVEAESAVKDDNTRRAWRLFLGVEGLLLIAIAVTSVFFTFLSARWTLIPITVLWTWLGFTLPICVLYLIGHPPVITLSPLILSAEKRASRRELQGLTALSDDEFYARYYAGSGIPADIPARIRRCLLEFDSLADRLVPADCLLLLDDDLDYADVLHSVAEEFVVAFSEADYPEVDGTLDNLIRLVHARHPG
jgi:hypothetical protein